MYGYSNFGFMVSYEESYKFRTDIVQYSKSKKLWLCEVLRVTKEKEIGIYLFETRLVHVPSFEDVTPLTRKFNISCLQTVM